MKKIVLFFIVLLLPLSLNVQASDSSTLGRSFLVSTDWLSEHLNDKNLVLLEVRYHPHRYLTVGHIPGAIQVERFADLGDNFANPLMRLPSRKQFQNTLRRWGVKKNSTIVIYDDSATALASRVFFLLDLYGFNMKQVKILDGGVREWSAFEDLETKPNHPKRSHIKIGKRDHSKYVEWTAIYRHVVSERRPNITLLDARPFDMYTGKLIKHAIRGGHIPGAINIVSLNGIEGQNWISVEDLQKMYQPIPKDHTVYVYCHDGFRMSLAYVQLKSLGYKDVRLYNGGWSHWGNALTLPVVEGDKPYSGDFEL